MNIPVPSTIKESVCLVLMRHAEKTKTEIFHILNNTSRAGIERNLGLLVDAGLVLQNGRCYSLCAELRNYYANHKPTMPTQSLATAFKPLKGLPMPLIRPDAEPLREIAFKTGSVGFFPSYRD